MKQISIWDKFVAVSTYYTFCMTGIIWLIASMLIFKKQVTPFCLYHIYQSIFISVLLYVITWIFNFTFPFARAIPFVGEIFRIIELYLFNFPIFYTFSLFNLILFMILSYLSLGAIFGKLSYFPFISDVIRANFRN